MKKVSSILIALLYMTQLSLFAKINEPAVPEVSNVAATSYVASGSLVVDSNEGNLINTTSKATITYNGNSVDLGITGLTIAGIPILNLKIQNVPVDAQGNIPTGTMGSVSLPILGSFNIEFYESSVGSAGTSPIGIHLTVYNTPSGDIYVDFDEL